MLGSLFLIFKYPVVSLAGTFGHSKHSDGYLNGAPRYFLQGIVSIAHSQPLQPINSRGCVPSVFLSLRKCLFLRYVALYFQDFSSFSFRCRAVNLSKYVRQRNALGTSQN